jgi:hypothetical protein
MSKIVAQSYQMINGHDFHVTINSDGIFAIRRKITHVKIEMEEFEGPDGYTYTQEGPVLKVNWITVYQCEMDIKPGIERVARIKADPMQYLGTEVRNLPVLPNSPKGWV